MRRCALSSALEAPVRTPAAAAVAPYSAPTRLGFTRISSLPEREGSPHLMPSRSTATRQPQAATRGDRLLAAAPPATGSRARLHLAVSAAARQGARALAGAAATARPADRTVHTQAADHPTSVRCSASTSRTSTWAISRARHSMPATVRRLSIVTALSSLLCSRIRGNHAPLL